MGFKWDWKESREKWPNTSFATTQKLRGVAMMQVLKGATMAPVRSPWYIDVTKATKTFALKPSLHGSHGYRLSPTWSSNKARGCVRQTCVEVQPSSHQVSSFLSWKLVKKQQQFFKPWSFSGHTIIGPFQCGGLNLSFYNKVGLKSHFIDRPQNASSKLPHNM